MTGSILILLSLLGFCQAILYSENVQEHFASFKTKYHKRYANEEEEARRLGYFTANMKEVDRLNLLGGSTHGITKFADMSKEEFNIRNGFKIPASSNATPKGLKKKIIKNNPFLKEGIDATAVTSVNWADPTLNVVTPVKNQGQCGSCWAHSTAQQIESQWALDAIDSGNFNIGGEIWEFSVQQVASCTTTCEGCGGGWQQDGYEYIMSLTSSSEGLGSQYFAPYTQSMVTACSDSSCTMSCSELDVSALTEYSSLTGPFATLSGWDYVTPTCLTNSANQCASQNMTAIEDYLTTSGPIAIVVDASNWGSYTGGVFTATQCGSSAANSMDHAVQLVGFNSGANPPYWIVRNSWSTDWGESGYIYLSYPGNTCGIANSATYVQISNGQDAFSV